MPTFSVSTSRFPELSIPACRRSRLLAGVLPVPDEYVFYPVDPCGTSGHRVVPVPEDLPRILVGVPSQGALLEFWIDL